MAFNISSSLKTIFNIISFPFVWTWKKIKAIGAWIVGPDQVSPQPELKPKMAPPSSNKLKSSANPSQSQPLTDVKPPQPSTAKIASDAPLRPSTQASQPINTIKTKPAPFDPKDIPEQYYNFFQKKSWLANFDLYYYIVYLAYYNPVLYCPEFEECGTLSLHKFKIDERDQTIKETDRYSNLYKLATAQLMAEIKKPQSKQKAIFAYPLHLSDNHWTLVLIDRNNRTLEYYNSKPDYEDSSIDKNGNKIIHSAESIRQDIARFTNELDRIDPPKAGEKPYRFKFKTPEALQPDSYQCGPWVLYFLEERLKNPNTNFAQLSPMPDIATYRLEVGHTLVEEKRKIEQRLSSNSKLR